MYYSFDKNTIGRNAPGSPGMMHPGGYRRFFLFSFLLLISVTGMPAQKSPGNLVIRTAGFSYEIAPSGRNISFRDNYSGVDYYDGGKPTYVATVRKNGKDYPATSVSLKGKILAIRFEEAGVSAEILSQVSGNSFSWEILTVSGSPETITFLDIPLTLKASPDEPFGVCALSMNLETQVTALPPLQSHLTATCHRRFGIKGGEVTVLGVAQPRENLLPALQEIMKKAKNIPFSDEGGAWALSRKSGYGSYLMNFGSIHEENVDDWINNCRALGFNQIDYHGGSDFFRFGDLELNAQKWPEGWNSFKRINQRLLQQGIMPILHTYAFFLDKKSVYVTPVPDKGLAFSGRFTLVRPITDSDEEIEVKESTADISTITGFFERNSVSLRIGDELITFTGVTRTAPFRFTGCKRGAYGTKASAYKAGTQTYHLKECFGLFLPDPDSLLFTKVAQQTARIAEENHFGGLYFDAIDGSDILGGGDYAWYYGTKFIFEVAKHLKRPIGMEMSAMWHHFWHYRTRWQAWDKPIRGQKRFVDLHLESIKGQNMMLPLHLGWWENKTWDPPQTERSFPDHIDYLGAKMIGNNAGLSMLKGVDKETYKENPLLAKLAERIKQHEELRQQNYFSEEIKSALRQPGKEFRLFNRADGSWGFKPVVYQRHKVSGNDASTSKWNVQNEFAPQQPGFRIEALMSVKPYDDSGNVTLTTSLKPEQFAEESSGGIEAALKVSSEKTGKGEPAWVFSARNEGRNAINASWVKMESPFDSILDLDKYQGLGVWIKGDGSGQLLNLSLQGTHHLSYGARADRYIKIDFSGWKYFELVEFESDRSRDYRWPFSDNLYQSFFFRLNFSSVEKLQMWYNNLPAGREVSAVVGPVKALPLVSGTIRNPVVTVNGESIMLPVEMESGMYIEFNSLSDCKLYNAKGELLKEITPEGVLGQLKNGANEIAFSCAAGGEANPRAQITLMTEGEELR